MRPKINWIGAGRLGKFLAKLIADHDLATIESICNLSVASNQAAISFIGQGKSVSKIQNLPPADVTFITTPDNCIEKCCQQLAENSNLNKSSIVVHCSGALSSKILHDVKLLGCSTGSIHPMKSFAMMTNSSSKKIFCALEGDTEAIEVISNLFKNLGFMLFNIDSDKKEIYHAAGVFASNYLVTLFNTAQVCLQHSKVEKLFAKEIIINLMLGTLENIRSAETIEEALTGPIARSDVDIIKLHLEALPNKITNLYKALGLETIEISNLSAEKKAAIARILLE